MSFKRGTRQDMTMRELRLARVYDRLRKRAQRRAHKSWWFSAHGQHWYMEGVNDALDALDK